MSTKGRRVQSFRVGGFGFKRDLFRMILGSCFDFSGPQFSTR